MAVAGSSAAGSLQGLEVEAKAAAGYSLAEAATAAASDFVKAAQSHFAVDFSTMIILELGSVVGAS